MPTLQHHLPAIRQHHLLMVKMDVPDRHVAVTAPNGLTVHASFLDAFTGEVVRDIQINLTGPVTLHFFASKKDVFAGWFYIAQWFQPGERFVCSCLESKQVGWCEHLQGMEMPVTA